MKWISATFLITTLLFSAVAFGQMAMPKPAPELKKLDYFNGNWKIEGDMKPSPMGPGGKWTQTAHNEWFPGNFFLVMNSTYSGAGMGEAKGMAHIGYNPEEKVYTYHEFTSMGEDSSSKGTLDGDTWTWTSEEKFGGQTMRGRFIIKQLSPTAYTVKYDMAPPNGDFATMMEGKATKQ